MSTPYPTGGPGTSGYPPPHGPSTTSQNAVWALVASICGLVLVPFVGIVGIVLGRTAIREIDVSGGRVEGRGLATAAIVLGWIGVVLSALAVVVLVWILAVVGASLAFLF